MGLYRFIFDTYISTTDPEDAHAKAMSALRRFGEFRFISDIARATIFRSGHGNETVFARSVPGMVGLAAGLDKNAEAILGLSALGFGFIEVGTITPQPQPGNYQPRLWRQLDIRAIRNRMGFNNNGMHAARAQLAKLRATKRGQKIVVGVNIGKNKWVAAPDAPADYRAVAGELAPFADYLVINVSSPNTPGLRDLQSIHALRDIIRATKETAGKTPILVKIAPDLADGDISEIAQLVIAENIAGVVATNTTINHQYGPGGLSGPPLLERSVAVVRQLRRELGPRFVIIGVGGISSIDDAQRLRNAGADLLQIFTSFIYEGPFFPAKLNRAL